jgi:hypothetical protein
MDRHHVQISTSSMSCGILELSHIGDDYAKVTYAIATRLYHPARGAPAAIVAWSTTNTLLADWVTNEFGRAGLVSAGSVENPLTSNLIFTYLWLIPHTKLRAWYKEYRIAKIRRD